MYKTFTLENEELKCCSIDKMEKVRQKTKFKKWLQKILIKLLYKFDLVRDIEITANNFKEVTISFDKVYEMIDRKMQEEIYFKYRDERSFLLLIGRDHMKKLTNEDMDEQLNFLMPYEMDGSLGRKYKEIEVVMIPRFKGLVLLEKKCLEQKQETYSYNQHLRYER